MARFMTQGFFMAQGFGTDRFRVGKESLKVTMT
jgi:hypothetical protein